MNRESKHTTLMFITAVLLIAGFILIWGCEWHEEHSRLDVGRRMESMDPPNPNTAESTEQKVCPVTGYPINKNIYTEYKGKKVYFCTEDCKKMFEKDPEKYISKLPQFQEKK